MGDGVFGSARAGQPQRSLVRPSESHAPHRASPEVQQRQLRQPPQRPRHSRPAVLPEAILPTAGKGGGSLAAEEERNRVDVNRANKERVVLGWLRVEESRK